MERNFPRCSDKIFDKSKDLFPSVLKDLEEGNQAANMGLRIIGDVIAIRDNREMIDFLNEKGFFEHLETAFRSPNSELRKEGLWILSNLLASNPSQIDMIIDHKSLVIAAMSQFAGSSFVCRKEALYSFRNLCTSGNRENIS